MKIKTVTAFDPIAREDRTFYVVPMSTLRALGIIENAANPKAVATRVMLGEPLAVGSVELLCASRDRAYYYATPMPVIFRMADKAHGGGCIAIFPTEPYSLAGDSYDATTAHGQTQVGFDVANMLRLATPAEYADLLSDIQCYNPERNLRIVKRISAKMRETYACKVREDRAIVRRESDCQLPADRDMSAADWNRL